MKERKKIVLTIIVFLTILLSSCQVFATDFSSYLGEMKFSDEFKKYMELNDEEKKNVIMPKMYEIPKNTMTITNPLKMAKMLGSTLSANYSLKNIIPENMVIKNQSSTNSCWTFSSLATLESTLALKDYNNGETATVYDFSERHMEYATSKTFLNNAINENGFNREVGDGGNFLLYIPYLINGTGAIAESQMPFEDNEDKIYITEIQNKDVVTQVNDIVTFPSYSSTDDLTQIKKQMKEHIKNYGAIDAGIYGASLFDNNCYNNETGAIYCSDSTSYSINHAVAVIGWNDNYRKENFVEGNRPENNGAWIIKNSWGSEFKFTLEEMKETIFDIDEYKEYYGWTDVTQIPDDLAIQIFEDSGYTIENNVATLKIGDNGFMYVSYEDVNIYQQLTGIIDAQTDITYENIYQYDEYGGFLSIDFTIPKIYLATEFDKKTTSAEYLTQVSITATETYTCKVYVNTNGTSKSMDDLEQVQLKAGETETFDAGYHTIEFAKPIEIKSDKFVVVLEIQGTQTDSMSTMMEFNFGEFVGDNEYYASNGAHIYDNVTVESGKCFWTVEDAISSNEWIDTSQMNSLTDGYWPNFDTTIKAFTTSEVITGIEITTSPTKTKYIVGEDFDATGMVVKAKYANGKSKEITDYTISNGTDLNASQTSVTISYEEFSATQEITVVENVVESIEITTLPTKTEYIAGEDFDATGMVIEATYTDGSTKVVTDYTIKDGTALKNGQTTVTIEYEGKSVTQTITVTANAVVKIEITQAPTKTKYVVGQNFDATGMVVEATYENGMVKNVEDYTVQDGTNLKENQTTVTIEYEEQTATQEISVEVKAVTSISVKTMPSKTEYIQNKDDLDLTGGVIEISYNDDTKEEMSMTSEEITVSGFSNEELGTKTITLTYQNKSVQFEVEVVELPKPENSNFDNMQGTVTRIRAYYFTDSSKQDYTVINVELDNIIKATENDSMEYYYYLSSAQGETDIANWVKIDELQDSGDTLSFEINTSEISNYGEVTNANNLYLYIKEVATRNDMQAEELTAVALEVENINIEEYIDGEKVADVNTDTIIDSTSGTETDNTLAQGTIPKAGKNVLIIIMMLAVLVIGRIAYLKYKDIQIK